LAEVMKTAEGWQALECCGIDLTDVWNAVACTGHTHAHGVEWHRQDKGFVVA
jgi:hypothetical protein